jgi:hypothetical protein
VTRRRITHYRRGSTAACTARIRPPALTAETADVDCGNCERTRAFKSMAGLAPVSLPLPPVDALYDGPADPADVPLIREWIARLAG